MNCHLAVGILLYQNSARELSLALAGCDRALKFAAEKFEQREEHLTISKYILDNSPKPTGIPGEFREWEYQKNIRNNAFAGGHNQLMRLAFGSGADFYVMVNPDGFPDNPAFFEMVEVAQSDNRVGLVESLQFPLEHPKPWDLVTWDTPWCSCACALISAAAFGASGGFDEQFWMYCEDVDLSWRLRYGGMALKVAPRALFFHDVADRTSPSVRRNMLMSGRYLGRKWSASGFVDHVNRCLVQEGFYPDAAYLPSIPSAAQIFPYETDIVEFRQLFSFAIPRWQ